MKSTAAFVGLVLLLLTAGTEIVVAVTTDRIDPAHVTVARGTRVRWQAPASVMVSLDLDDHGGQHVVTARAGSVVVTFLDSGSHPYVVRVGAGRHLRGEVAVEAGTPAAGPVCARGSSRSLCIEP